MGECECAAYWSRSILTSTSIALAFWRTVSPAGSIVRFLIVLSIDKNKSPDSVGSDRITPVKMGVVRLTKFAFARGLTQRYGARQQPLFNAHISLRKEQKDMNNSFLGADCEGIGIIRNAEECFRKRLE